jgi:hypothetical protein
MNGGIKQAQAVAAATLSALTGQSRHFLLRVRLSRFEISQTK